MEKKITYFETVGCEEVTNMSIFCIVEVIG